MKKMTLDEIKKVELGILIKFDEFCHKHKLYYTLAGGTLLGAVRHKGFIPWDDDIDVMMPREDYERLLKMIKSGKGSDNMSFLLPGKKGNKYPFLKAVDPATRTRSSETLSRTGLWIDIFPLDHLPADDTQLRHMFMKTRFMRAATIAYDTDLRSCRKNYKYLIKAMLKCYVKLVGIEKFLDQYDAYVQKYSQEETGYIGCAMWGYGVGERISHKRFLSAEQVEFEGHHFCAPSCWREYLTGLYGDFMQLPPESKRVARHQLEARYIE